MDLTARLKPMFGVNYEVDLQNPYQARGPKKTKESPLKDILNTPYARPINHKHNRVDSQRMGSWARNKNIEVSLGEKMLRRMGSPIIPSWPKLDLYSVSLTMGRSVVDHPTRCCLLPRSKLFPALILQLGLIMWKRKRAQGISCCLVENDWWRAWWMSQTQPERSLAISELPIPEADRANSLLELS